MSGRWTVLMEGETKESLAAMVCERREQQQAGQAEAHPAAAPAAEHPSPSRSEVLEEAIEAAQRIVTDFDTKLPRAFDALIVDRAAAGEDVTVGIDGDSYQPQPWPRQP